MAAGQWPGGDGGGLWAAPQLQLPLESLVAGGFYPDEPSPAAILGLFGGGPLSQLPSPPPLRAAALLGYPQNEAMAMGSRRLYQVFFTASLSCNGSSHDLYLANPCFLETMMALDPTEDNFEMFHEQDRAQLASQVARSVLEEPTVDLGQLEPFVNQSAQTVELPDKQGGGLYPKVIPHLVHSKCRVLNQADSSSFSLATSVLTPGHVSSSAIVASMQGVPTLPSHVDDISTGSTGVLQGLQGSSITLDKPDDDGYNWRKYGQKAVKGGKYPKSYYKCTLNCPVRKNVEHSADGRIIKIIYRGQHSHERPLKRFGDCSGLPNGLDGFSVSEDASTRSQPHRQGYYEKPITSNDTMTGRLMGMRAEGDEQLPGSSVRREEGDDELRTVDGATADANGNERNAPGQKIIVSTTSDVDYLDDGYRWRKYGQKVVRGNPHPRSYYKCAHRGCIVKKHIERSSQEPHAVITTYEGKHIHDVPATKNTSHAAGSTPLLHNTMSNGQPWRTEQSYSEQSPASFCSRPEKRKYRTIILNHLAF